MKDFLEHTYSIVSTSFDRHLHIKQKQIQNESPNKNNNLANDQNDLRDTLRNKSKALFRS